MTEAAGADCTTGETQGLGRRVGIALGTLNCLGAIEGASMRLILGITGEIGVVVVKVMGVSCFVMGLIGTLGAMSLT